MLFSLHLEVSNSQYMNDFFNEITTLKIVHKHPNIVTLIGHSLKVKPYLMIMEYLPCGNLRRYLHNLRTEWAVKNKQKSVT